MKPEVGLHRAAAFALALALASAGAIGAPADERMEKLAFDSGCTLCHATQSKNAGMPVLPPAPAWNDIALRYRGQPGAEDRLVAAVALGARPEYRHWQGKTSDLAMPANAAEISERDARALVRWILDQ